MIFSPVGESPMKTVSSWPLLLACLLPLNAQINSTLSRSPDGSDEVRIQNNSAIGLAAYAVTVAHLPLSAYSSVAPFVVYSDTLIDATASPLLPGEARVVMTMGFGLALPLRGGLLKEPITFAGIFVDGTINGDPSLLTRLISRRSNMLQAVETVLEILSDAGRRNTQRDQLIAELRNFEDSVSHGYLSPEQQVGRALYSSFIGKLTNLPVRPVGTPFPPSAFVAEETAVLNRQRVVLRDSQPSLVDAAFIERQGQAIPRPPL